MFKRIRKFKTSFDNSKYIKEFMQAYDVEYISANICSKVCYIAKMDKREYGEFLKYIIDLSRFRIYPIEL